MTRFLLALVLAASLVALSACTTPDQPAEEPPAAAPDAGGGAAGTQLAVGLHEQEDGTAVAVGWLEEVDLEGGLWRIVDLPPTSSANSKTIAVIANKAGVADKLEDLRGKQVQATGKKLDGVSIRMAGTEIEVTEIVEAGPPGIAE